MVGPDGNDIFKTIPIVRPGITTKIITEIGPRCGKRVHSLLDRLGVDVRRD